MKYSLDEDVGTHLDDEPLCACWLGNLLLLGPSRNVFDHKVVTVVVVAVTLLCSSRGILGTTALARYSGTIPKVVAAASLAAHSTTTLTAATVFLRNLGVLNAGEWPRVDLLCALLGSLIWLTVGPILRFRSGRALALRRGDIYVVLPILGR